jgi:hypothetical protein
LIKELGFEVELTNRLMPLKRLCQVILEISVIVGQVVKENDSLLIAK